MAIVSDVEIRLRADIARLQQDMDSARRTVGTGLDRINAAVAKTIGTFAGLAVAAGGMAFATFIKNAIDATDKVSDLSQATGVAIEDVAGLQLAFMKGGLEAGAFETSMVKLSKEIADNNEGFKRLGVQTKDSAGGLRSNKDVLYEVADAFQNLEDGTQKTALAIEIFGKSGAALIPLLNEGAEGLKAMDDMAVKLGLTFDEKTVEAAGDFNDTLDFLGLASQGVARQVAAELLPALQSIAGAFLTLITDGNGVSKMAQGIIAVFKVLYTAGAGVAQIFSTLGKTIGAAAAQVVAVLQGDFATAGKIGREWAADLGESWSSTAKSISDVWTGAGGEVVAAMTATQRTGTKVADAAAKDAQKQASAYEDLVLAIKIKIKESDAEAAGRAKLNDADKMAIELTEKLASGKLKLAPLEEQQVRALIEQYRANLDNIEANKLAAKELEEYNKAQNQVWEGRAADIKKAKEEAEANEKLAATFGMTKGQIEGLELARLQEQLAQEDGIALTQDEITHLETLIALKQRSAAAAATVASLEENKRLWESIDKTAHDTFVSIANGGKDTATRLRESFENGFFDWLYQQTAKPFLVQLQASVSGGGGGGLASLLSAAGNAAGSGTGLGSLLGSAGGALGMIGGIGTGALQTAGALVTGQIGLGSTVSAGLAALSSGSAAGISAGLASLGGAIIPVLGGVMAAVTVLSKAFGRGPKEVTSQGITGTFGTDGFSGTQFQEWIKKGGWLRSDKTGTDTPALDPALAAQLSNTYKTIKDSTTAFATALGLPVETITSYTKQLKLVLTGDAAKDQAALAAAFGEISDELATGLIPGIMAMAKEGETATAALARLAQEYAVSGAVFETIGVDAAKAFGAVGLASIEARARLIDLAGGVEALASQTQFFATNFMTEAERIAPVQKALTEQLAALGKGSLTTSEQYKAAVLDLANSGALATAEGAKLYAGLLALGPAFKQVADYTAQLADVAAEQAKAQAEAIAQAAANLAAVNAPFEQQIAALLKARMTEAEVIELETRGMDASTLALYNRVKALQAEDAATLAATAARQKAAQAAKDSQAKLEADLVRIAGAREGLAGEIFDAMLGGQDIQTRIGTLKKAEDDLWASVKGGDTATLNKIKALAMQRIALEDQLHDKTIADLQEQYAVRKTALTDELNGMLRMRDFARSIGEFAKGLQFSALSALSPADQRAAAEAQYKATLAAARGGDVNAQGNLQSIAQTFLELEKSFFGSSQAYGATFAQVLTDLQTIPAATDAQIIAQQTQISAIEATSAALATAVRDTGARQEAVLERIDAALRSSQESLQTQVASGAALNTALLEQLTQLNTKVGEMESKIALSATAPA
jgi:hypothetical protein